MFLGCPFRVPESVCKALRTIPTQQQQQTAVRTIVNQQPLLFIWHLPCVRHSAKYKLCILFLKEHREAAIAISVLEVMKLRLREIICLVPFS